MVSKALVILTMCFAISCQTTGVNFNPDFAVLRVDESDDAYLIHENGFSVFQYQEEFQLYGCLSEQKIKELRELLLNAQIPKREKTRLLNILNSLN